MIIHTTRLKERVGGEASLRGWLVSKQARGQVAFLTLRDGEGTAQLVCERAALGDEAFEALKALPLEAPILATGLVRLPEGRDRPELALRELEAGPSAPDWPIGRKEHGPDFLMERRHLWIRAPRQAAILRIRSSLEFACVEFLHREGFHRFDAPLVTPTACEGTTELFELDYFGKAAYLSQSAQLYAEAGIAALERVYSLGPCFRAEKSVTRRHLTEFWGVEPEMAHVDAVGNMAFQERFIRAVLRKVAEEREGDLAFLGRDPESLVFGPEPFPVLLYDEVLERLSRQGREVPWGEDLSVEDEEALAAGFATPFFVYKYPVKCRAFYIEPDPADPRLALSSDCLAPGLGEIITGGQRASDHDFLKSRIVEHGLSLDDFAWYLDLRRYGSVTHSGFGMGIERMLRFVCGLRHIREAIPFARTPQRIAP
ncbi:MAG: asparagine--tRNA ligase [Spirochaetaceae bacterium]|nr:asparagine--tRNA ligase [Spirochaetaceae bacterium]